VVEGSCEVPVGAYAQVNGDRLLLQGFIGLPDGSRLVRESIEGPSADGERLGARLGERLLAAGGREILERLRQSA
jgi:hydroxymethylbilane synthase